MVGPRRIDELHERLMTLLAKRSLLILMYHANRSNSLANYRTLFEYCRTFDLHYKFYLDCNIFVVGKKQPSQKFCFEMNISHIAQHNAMYGIKILNKNPTMDKNSIVCG